MLIVIFKGLLCLSFSNIFIAGSEFSSISSVVERSCLDSEYGSCTDYWVACNSAGIQQNKLMRKAQLVYW